MNKIVIDCKNVSFKYKTYKKSLGFKGEFLDFFKRETEYVPALKSFDLRIAKGEIVGLLGANGAGKTTLIKILSGVIPSNSGSVMVLGYNPYEKKARFLHKIGVLFGQKSQLIWDLPAVDTFSMLKEIYQIPTIEFHERLNYLATELDISEVINRPVRNLSLGQRTKCELVCSLITKPEIVFLDEPTLGIDIISQMKIYALLKKFNETSNMTILLTSHNTKDIETLAKRVVIINKGIKRFDDSLKKLMTNFSNRYFLEVTTDKEIDNEILEGITKLGQMDYLVDAKKFPTLPFDTKHILKVQRKDSSLDQILERIFLNKESD
ncbi:hypothetical protein A7K95_01745 [Pediococcus parvulus]|uniref:ATP-binding cassette domain-containing protein n=1 Tax=Pediococcus parvulus TaxID=54062 RepID=A0AAP5WDV3_9LACO|nr:ATP-binding cassette domain-containing protein [Pediococcus parvulus]MDV7694746.1 ATP-binding cassette domain-containing protein [Pediococcus parvulus]OAD63275.1 hypothetical protein A7K95_01745 [Pediococcus parvulus]